MGRRLFIPSFPRQLISFDWTDIKRQSVLSNPQVRDTRYLVSFPSFITAQIPLAFNNLMTRVHGPDCPTEATRWTGSSWGCYQNPELDRTIHGLQTSVDLADQQRLWRDLVRIHAQELPVLPLYHNVTVVMFKNPPSESTA